MLLTHKLVARRPQISSDTLILTDERDLARADGDFDRESNLSRQIKQRVKSNKSHWLDNAIASGDWSKSSPGQANRLGPRADTGWHKATASEHHHDVDGRLCTTYASEYICAALRRAGG